MTSNDLAAELDKLIIAGITQYERAIVGVQNTMYEAMLVELKDLELVGGYIKQNAANRRIIRSVQEQFDRVISESNYQPALERYLRIIPKIDALTGAYFKSIDADFLPNRAFLRSLQTQTIKNINSLILSDGLNAAVKIPLNQILEQNISSGGSYQGMLEQVRDYVIGTEREGQLLRYTRTYTTDALFSYARGYMEAVTNDLKLDWYIYSGGLIDKTREFCEEKTGKYFHRKEIEAWAGQEWRGKRPAQRSPRSSFFSAAYNCRHELIPVSTSIVPAEDLDRITG